MPLILRRLTLALALIPAAASATDWAPDAAFLQFGAGEDTRAGSGGLLWDWGQHELLSVPLGLYGEVSLGRWHSDAVPGRSSAWFTEFGVTPVLRYRFERSSLFVEAGIGLHLISPHYENGDKRFSTRFNFGDHVAVGARLGERENHELALRLQHFSNGGIRKPNPGENFVQLRYTLYLD